MSQEKKSKTKAQEEFPIAAVLTAVEVRLRLDSPPDKSREVVHALECLSKLQFWVKKLEEN